MKSRIALANVVVLGLIGSSCAALGPKANVSMMKSEISATKDVENIIIPNVTGIDASGNTGKALLGNALKAYGTRSRPMAAANAVLGTVGAPDGLADLLTAAYSAEFIKEVQNAKDKKPEKLALPSAKVQFKLPEGLDGMKALAKKFQGEAAGIAAVGAALKSGKSGDLSASVAKSQSMMSLVQKLDELLFEQLDVTYVLLTHVDGNEQDWLAGKNVKYSAALMNIKTGKLRYFATVEAKKGAIPTPFMAQIGIMASNLFDAVNEKDPLPAKKDAKGTAQMEVNVYRY